MATQWVDGGAPEWRRGQASAASGEGACRSAARTYAALDLGTNNCRLLIARPAIEGFRIVDAFSRIVRLGEGLSQTGQLSEAAIARTLDALLVCRDKLVSRGVARVRLVATEACRAAVNGAEFLARVEERTGLNLEVVDRETEAHLAAAGCASLADRRAASIVLFDIGGGSSEIVWLASPREGEPFADTDLRDRVRAWASLKLGVVTLAEHFGGIDVSPQVFEEMVEFVAESLEVFTKQTRAEHRCSHFHLLGTSGTVTTLAGVHLNLARYDRRRVDGLWMADWEINCAMQKLRNMAYRERVSHGCIGPDRADLVLAGCAIFEAIRRAFPTNRIRIADRGLREGMLMQMMSADRAWSKPPADGRP